VASVWRHPESQYWTACFRDENGRERRITTKETNSKKALKIAEDFERAVKTGRTLRKSSRFWSLYTRRFRANELFGPPFEKWLTAKSRVIHDGLLSRHS
jgi:hypothetical protein